MCKGSGERFTEQNTLVGVGDALVVAFGQTKAACLIEIILRGREFFEIGARLKDGAIAARRAGVKKRERRDVSGEYIRLLKNLAAVRGEIVGEGARSEDVR